MTKKKIIIISAVSLLLVTAFVIGLVAVILSQKHLDYMKDDLSRYIRISEKDYKDFTVELDLDKVTDKDVERKILNLLYENRAEKPKYDGANVTNLPITVGDRVHLYYRGYTVDENGNQTELPNASNLFSEMAVLDIGALEFIPGFEESLIGINPKDCPLFEYITNGEVKTGDVIYLTYSAILPDGTTTTKTSERIDLSSANVDTLYGAGFKKFFLGKTIGTKLTEKKTFELADGSAVYYEMTVDGVTRCEKDAVTIDAYFPKSYSEESLRGVHAKFDVYVRYINVYETPEYNEKFITETLKMTAEDLKEYDGATILEKHKAYLRAEAEKENEEIRKSFIEASVWVHLKDKVKVKRLPESDVNEIYDEYFYEIQATYQTYYSGTYQNVDAFAVAYLGLDANANWRAYITKRAEDVITEKLIFYYIIREQGLVPDKAEFDKLYNESVEEYLKYYSNDIYKEELDKITDEAEKAERMLQIREEMLTYYGEGYFEEIVYYDFAKDKIIDFAKIVEKGN